MTAPWTAERVVSPDEARALITEQHPGVRASSVEPLGQGWDNTAFAVDGTWVFRFPRREIAVQLLEIEARVLPVIADHLPLPIPRPEYVGEPTEAYPWPFIGYRMLRGRTVDRAALSIEQRAELAEPVGEFLAALHQIDPELSRAPDDEIDCTDTRRRLPMVRAYLEQVEATGQLEDLGAFEPILALAHDSLPPRRVLVHADVYARHVLVDDRGRACGVIDWGDVHLGHPGLDMAPAFCLLPPHARERFRRAYGRPIDDESWTLGRQRGLLYGAALAAYGSDTNDRALVDEGLQVLRWMLE